MPAPKVGRRAQRGGLGNPRIKAVWAKVGPGLGSPQPRRLALASMIVELGLLLLLLGSPVFWVAQIDLSGNRSIPTATVLKLAGLSRPVSIFAIDPAQITGALSADPWVRSATAQDSLPDRLSLKLVEWPVVALWHQDGQVFQVSPTGADLGTTAASSALTTILDSGARSPRVGRRLLPADLLAAMVRIRAGFPTWFPGQQVADYEFGCDGSLVLVAKEGWRVYFGRMLTPQEINALPKEVSALYSLKGAVNFSSSVLDYINVMNPSAPAVRMGSPRGQPGALGSMPTCP